MARIPLTSDSGKWFDDEKAVKFEESRYFDGHNFISRATGSQWEHEELYFTVSGNWILGAYSAYQHVDDTYDLVSEETAVDWLISQRCFEDANFSKLPASVQDRVKASFAKAEL